MRRAALLGCLLALMGSAVQARSFTDAAGRTVEVPDRISRVAPAGPPASVLMFTLAPDKLVGWTHVPEPEAAIFLPERYAALPESPRITGKSGPTDLDAVKALKPELIVDVGTMDKGYAALADEVQAATGIPYILLDGRLGATASTYRALGILLGTEARAEQLAAYAEATLAGIAHATAGTSPVSVYYGRGAEGLTTGGGGSINLEFIGAAGGRNVAADLPGGGLADVTAQQVTGWNPAAIVTLDTAFAKAATSDPAWTGIEAVKEKRILLAPSLPFGWVDSPPSVNRLIGLRWLAARLHPDHAKFDVAAEISRFYELFYGRTPTDAEIGQLFVTRSP